VATIINVIPAIAGAFLATNPLGWYATWSISVGTEVAGGSMLTYVGTELVTIPKSLNIIRLYDYSSIYGCPNLMVFAAHPEEKSSI
jgi:hypothetical protein